MRLRTGKIDAIVRLKRSEFGGPAPGLLVAERRKGFAVSAVAAGLSPSSETVAD